MIIKYVMAKKDVVNRQIKKGEIFKTVKYDNDELIDIIEEDSVGYDSAFTSCSQVEFDQWFVEMTLTDYVLYFNENEQQQSKICELIRRLYNCN